MNNNSLPKELVNFNDIEKDIIEKNNTSTSHQTIKNKVDFNVPKALENERMVKYLHEELKGKRQIIHHLLK